MILSDRDIEKAVRAKRIIFSPPVDHSQFDSSSLNLRVGEDFRIWKESLRADATTHSIDLDRIDLSQIMDLTDSLPPDRQGFVRIPPDAFVLVRTLEHLTLPLKSKLAARIEGRSKFARLGMTVHITAPTIHAGFAGNITLEIKNFGPFELKVLPRESQLCQLIFETVSSMPERGGSRQFSHQATPLGTPQRRR